MYVVNVSVEGIRKEENPSFRYVVEDRRDALWTRKEVIDAEAGKEGNERKFLLEDNQRVVVELSNQEQVQFDQEQFAAVPKMSPEERRVAEEKRRKEDESLRKFQEKQLESPAVTERKEPAPHDADQMASSTDVKTNETVRERQATQPPNRTQTQTTQQRSTPVNKK